jgi:hypothetical protein
LSLISYLPFWLVDFPSQVTFFRHCIGVSWLAQIFLNGNTGYFFLHNKLRSYLSFFSLIVWELIVSKMMIHHCTVQGWLVFFFDDALWLGGFGFTSLYLQP